eukprot:gnl/TRDRNA2_/TRDRNA2_181869_c0_seq1.p1 gnl/TRDRNA2_/TRDRNA2_181869_c0~~gnl/TRDRNA2_/TRDRNA2_181869_c0_seq1.p1  ORF type:complete len:382 (+),score=71.12 gnl/TRDRNA2_/TRDRNA2_181869_c0_seq1:57-1202(+)
MSAPPTQQTPLTSPQPNQQDEKPPNKAAQMLHIVTLGTAMIIVSSGLIAFNKFLMTDSRFPYALPLVMVHTSYSAIVSVILLRYCPSLFPSMTDPLKKVTIDRELVLGSVLPISCLFSGQLVLSNAALGHASIAFCQFLKEGNIAVIYFLSVMVSIETFRWRNFGVLLCIICATSITIHGEAKFSMLGLLLRGSSLLFESSKLVLQTLLLSNTGKKLDAFTYLLLMTPMTFLLLSGTLGVEAVFFAKQLDMPSWSKIVDWGPLVLLNATVAYALNLVMANFCRAVSALGFALTGVLKDVMIVCVGVWVMNETVTRTQAMGFTAQIVLITNWSMMKMFPTEFEDGIVAGWGHLLDKALYGVSAVDLKEKAAAAGKKEAASAG